MLSTGQGKQRSTVKSSHLCSALQTIVSGQKLCLPENSEIPIFTIFVELEGNFFLIKKACVGLAKDLRLSKVKFELNLGK